MATLPEWRFSAIKRHRGRLDRPRFSEKGTTYLTCWSWACSAAPLPDPCDTGVSTRWGHALTSAALDRNKSVGVRVCAYPRFKHRSGGPVSPSSRRAS